MSKTANPFQSKLIPYLPVIARMRKTKPPSSFQAIADFLWKEHQIKVAVSSLYNFVRVRAEECKRGIVICPKNLPTAPLESSLAGFRASEEHEWKRPASRSDLFPVKVVEPSGPPIASRPAPKRVFHYPEEGEA